MAYATDIDPFHVDTNRKVRLFSVATLLFYRHFQRDRDHIADGTTLFSDVKIRPFKRETSFEYAGVPIGRERKRDLDRSRDAFDGQLAGRLVTCAGLFDLTGFIRDARILVRIEVLLFGPQVMVPHSDSRTDRFRIDTNIRLATCNGKWNINSNSERGGYEYERDTLVERLPGSQ
jgi:hypothetical protein